MELNRILKVLNEKGIKQTWLAEKLNKSYNMVNCYCKNRRQPSLETLFEISEILLVNVSDLLTCDRNQANSENANCAIFDVSVSFSEGDIVEFTERNGDAKRGYITEHNGRLQIRCPHPHYEHHPIYDNTTIVKKGAWKNNVN